MGIVKAAMGAVGGTLADSWLDYIKAQDMTPTTILTKGEQVSNKRSSNKKAMLTLFLTAPALKSVPIR